MIDLAKIAAAVVAVAAFIGAVRLLWQAWRRMRARAKDMRGDAVAVRDSILGRPPVVDTITGKEISPALPGIGQRMDTVERALVALADQHTVLENHEDRITRLEEARVERVVSQAESAAMWQAVGKAADERDDERPDM